MSTDNTRITSGPGRGEYLLPATQTIRPIDLDLVENILPTRSRATLVLSKGENHEVTRVRLRKI